MKDNLLKQLESDREEIKDWLQKCRLDLDKIDEAIRLREQEICEHKFDATPYSCTFQDTKIIIKFRCDKCGKIFETRANINFC